MLERRRRSSFQNNVDDDPKDSSCPSVTMVSREFYIREMHTVGCPLRLGEFVLDPHAGTQKRKKNFI